MQVSEASVKIVEVKSGFIKNTFWVSRGIKSRNGRGLRGDRVLRTLLLSLLFFLLTASFSFSLPRWAPQPPRTPAFPLLERNRFVSLDPQIQKISSRPCLTLTLSAPGSLEPKLTTRTQNVGKSRDGTDSQEGDRVGAVEKTTSVLYL